MSGFDTNLHGRHDFDMENPPVFNNTPEHFSYSLLPEGDMVLVMSYVKRQRWGDVLNCDAGLANGTIFPELVKPFLGQGGRTK